MRLRAWWFRMFGDKYRCHFCGGVTLDHCTPYRWRPGDQHRTGNVRCKWRVCQSCGAYGTPGGKWVSKVPKEAT